MTKEQEEIIEKLTNGEKIDFNTLVRKFKKEGIENFIVTKKEYIETVLSMLKEKDKLINSNNGTINALQYALKERTEERDRKDDIISNQNKIIDLMAEYIFQNVDVEEDICNSAYVECIQETAQDITCINCIKQYFERKATNNG